MLDIVNKFQYNKDATYPNGGQFLEILKAKDLFIQTIFVKESIDEFFIAKFTNIFTNYPLGAMKTTDKKWTYWQNEPLKLWQTQLNFAVWCASSACGVSSEHLNNKDHLIIKSMFRFHVYYHVCRVLEQLQAPLPHKDRFDQYDNPFNYKEFLKLCGKYGTTTDPMKYRGQYFTSSYQRKRKIYSGSGQSYFTNDSMTRWITEKSNGFTKQGLYMISESVTGIHLFDFKFTGKWKVKYNWK